MTETHIDSDLYWNTSFAEDGEACEDPGQSRFFARIAIDHLPRWLIEQLKRQSLSIACAGCVQGDGTADIWASYINGKYIVGADSSITIEQAAQVYPAICLINEDCLAEGGDKQEAFDVVFSSNMLRHFRKPYDFLHAICGRAKKAIVLGLPYTELERNHEHFFSVLPENIPRVLRNGFRLAWLQVVDCRSLPNTTWSGHQVILVYADPNWMDSLGLTLNDSHTEKSELSTKIDRVNTVMVERDRRIVRLNLISYPKKAEIAKLKPSTSSLLTRPLRFKRYFQNPKKSAYDLAKFVFWRLPPTTRQALQGPRHKFVRWVRGFAAPVHINLELANGRMFDLSWDDFNAQVLSRRGEYKGIFVQEFAIHWNVPLYQRPHHIAVAFGRLGYLVIYKTDNWVGDNVNGFREVSKNVWITNAREVNTIEGVVRSLYSTAYTYTPELMRENSKRGLLVYEYIDHIDPQISGDAENIRRLLALKDFAFRGGADYIVASARKLEAEAVEAVGQDKVILAQNGVDTRHYRNPIHRSTPLPEKLIFFGRKYSNIVGYFGALAPWLWYEAISALVASRPDLGFVFIGPDYYGGVEKLPKAENVLYLGTVDYKILPAYARQFDVCFIPFAPGEIARTTSPLKLFEYFALEKPVVVTSEMLECVTFKEVFSGGSPRALSQAIDAAIHVRNDASFKARLALLADENDWDDRVRAMEVIFKKLKEE